MYTLSSETPVLLQEVDEPRKVASKSMGMSNRPPQEPEAVLVDHHDLDPVVQETREVLAKAMHSRFFGRAKTHLHPMTFKPCGRMTMSHVWFQCEIETHSELPPSIWLCREMLSLQRMFEELQ
ncbi:hypothetical protein PsorP6_004600 [Peronosclerospora sorghi]|uniref:Uncharacterized protein n=1 Tax=Peronosclerospora sorghi TaxID=230839 RepID=A0ACC0VQK7_9STRA|nr:hypothetical protein PsorP6_004600 [Peronosclerospora sorghi]